MSSYHDVVLYRSSTKHSLFKCRLCRRYHPLRKCELFLRMSVEKRLRTVLKYGYCPNCLDHEHSGNNCRQDTGCHLCSKGHHTLLHFENSSIHYSQRDSTGHSRSRGITTPRINGPTSISTILSRHVISH